jgi:hypothetical protein
VLLTGLRVVADEAVPFDPGRVVAAYEAEQERERERWRAEARQMEREEAEELRQFRENLRPMSGPVAATWAFDPDGGWVVTAADGTVLGRGKVRWYGIDSFRKVRAILKQKYGPDSTLTEKLEPHQLLWFYYD